MRGRRASAAALLAAGATLLLGGGARAELVGFYSFDDGTANKTAGSTAANGVVSGAVATLTGYEGGAFDFGGDGDRIDFAIDVNPAAMPSITMGGWFNARSAAALNGLLSHDDGGFDRTLTIDNRGGGGVTYSAFTGSGVLAGAAPVLNQWTFVALRHTQGGALTLFVGAQSFTLNGPVNYGTGLATLTLGRNASFPEYFNGLADNLFVYNEALTDARVAEIRTGGAAAITGAAVPEPGTAALAALPALLGGLAFVRRRRTAA